jgi:hypothetical protein
MKLAKEKTCTDDVEEEVRLNSGQVRCAAVFAEDVRSTAPVVHTCAVSLIEASHLNW